MADVRITQPSYSAGEISEETHGRKDLAKTQVAVRSLENCFVHATGGISNRPGLRFVTEVKNSAQDVRLLTFSAAKDDAYILEAGDQYFRPIFRGAYIDNAGSPVEIVTPYLEAEIDDIYCDQSNDVGTFVHPLHAIRELSRLTAISWPFTAVSFLPVIAAPTVPVVVVTQPFTPAAATGNDELIVYKYKISAVSATGEESLTSVEAVAPAGNILGFTKNFNTISWAASATAIEYIVYKEKNGLYGFIGRTPNLTFKDDNIAPLFSDGPQQGNNPFNSASNYPSIVSFSQQRRVFAATINKPQTIWLTQSGNFKNLGASVPSKDDDSVEFTLAANQKQDVVHIVSLERGMIVFTRSGEWRVRGRDNDVITPASILPDPQTYYGANENLRPIVAGTAILFASKDTNAVYDMDYALERDRYKSNDLTLLAKHLFAGRRIVAWAYAANPYGVIWCVMDDGALVSLTYLKEHDVWGWGRHSTKGKFLDVASIPEDGRDVPYFIVRRRIGGVFKKYIEFLEDREFTDIQDAFFVDSGLSLDNPLPIAGISLAGPVTRLNIPAHGLTTGDEVEIDNAFFITGEDVEGQRLDGHYWIEVFDANNIIIRTSYDDGDTLVDVDTGASVTHYYEGSGVWRECFQTVSGLGHLEGRAVAVLAGGHVLEGYTVAAAAITLDRKYGRVHVGLGYRAAMNTLDLLNLQGDDTGLIKTAARVFLRTKDTRGVFVGVDLDNLQEYEPRDYQDYGIPAPMLSGVFETPLIMDWTKDLSIWTVQDYPLPMTILGTTTEQDYGG